MKLGQNCCLNRSQTTLKMGHGWSKTRSLDQILEKLCVSTIGHIFSLILMKHCRMYASVKSVTNLKLFHCGSETRSPGQNLKTDHEGSKTRSLDGMLEKPCVHSRGHIFCLTFMKLGQNVSIKSWILYKMGHVG